MEIEDDRGWKGGKESGWEIQGVMSTNLSTHEHKFVPPGERMLCDGMGKSPFLTCFLIVAGKWENG